MINVPQSTYRIQFNKSFTFNDLRRNISYFINLGIKGIYASPVFSATPGSMHGYDVTDPHKINPEIGSLEDFQSLLSELNRQGIGWIQDIVPNHMAFNIHNKWINDILEKGRLSRFANFFDIDWDHPEFPDQIMIPFLGKSLKEAITTQKLILTYNRAFQIRYYGQPYPVNSAGVIWLMQKLKTSHTIIEKIEGKGKNRSLDYRKFLYRTWPDILDAIATLYKTQVLFHDSLDNLISTINSDQSMMYQLLDRQYYRFAHWLDTERRINYRRFFTVNGLICLKMEARMVFDNYHTFINDMIKENSITGLRVDHIDGLKNPLQYLKRLRQMAGPDSYIIVEKILEKDESLPKNWPVQGNTGYDFLSTVTKLFTNKENYEIISRFYKDSIPRRIGLPVIIYRNKSRILYNRLGGELNNLHRLFCSLEMNQKQCGVDITSEKMKQAIAAFLVACPCYRLYSIRIPVNQKDAGLIRSMILQAEKMESGIFRELKLLQDIFLGIIPKKVDERRNAIEFFLRCMQFTGPIMAKGVEDTTMYSFHQFIAHNEVGDDPGTSGISIRQFHELMMDRQENWPLSMNTTSTHDTKRGEDVRARLNVLSDDPEEWLDHVRQWIEANKSFKIPVKGKMVPTSNEEYFIYQTLTGIWPFDFSIDDLFRKRIKDYLIKALRESKTHTAWNNPDEEHEKAVISFTISITREGTDFRKDLEQYLKKIMDFGILNSISQVVLKYTCPGVPDLYQGCELWDFSLVDPDNRKPVSYNKLNNLLQNLLLKNEKDNDDPNKDLLNNRRNGNIKLRVTHKLLQLRKKNPELFTLGTYASLDTRGTYEDHILSFARIHGDKILIVIIPMHLGSIPGIELFNKPLFWQDTTIRIPDRLTGTYISLMDGFRTEFRRVMNLNDIAMNMLPLNIYLKEDN